MQTVAHHIMHTLRKSGVEVVFGYPGQSNMLFLEAVRDVGMRYIQTADERGAGFAATGYVQATDKPTVVCASKGPAATNLLTPLLAAHKDGIPLLAITGNVDKGLYGRNSFQDFNPSSVFATAGAVKAARYVDDPSMIPAGLAQMFTTAWSEPYGPALLDVPYNILGHPLEADPVEISMGERSNTLQKRRSVQDVQRAAQCLATSQRPVLIVGSGARKDYKCIRAFARAYEIPVVHTMGGTGVISTGDYLYGGFLRHNGSTAAIYLVQHADVILALGTGLDERATGDPSSFASHAIKIQVDLNPNVLGSNIPMDIAINESIAGFLSVIGAFLPKDLNHSNWLEAFIQWKQKHPLPIRRTGILTSLEFVEATAMALPEAIVVKDSGAHKYWVTKYRPCLLPHHSIASCHFGTMGFGLPAAIGASIGRPEETVVAICGDGGLLMSLAELPTAVRERCKNLKIIVFNNGGLGSTRDFEKRLGRNEDFISDFTHPIPFAQYAEAMGIPSCTIRQRTELAALITCLQTQGLMLVDCIIDARESMYPAIPYTHSFDKLL